MGIKPNKEGCALCEYFDIEDGTCKKGKTLEEITVVTPWCSTFANKHVIKTMMGEQRTL